LKVGKEGEVKMKLLRRIWRGPDFRVLDGPISRLKEIRDSYREMNIAIYGEELASLLNDW
jgi:hypothetical protein